MLWFDILSLCPPHHMQGRIDIRLSFVCHIVDIASSTAVLCTHSTHGTPEVDLSMAMWCSIEAKHLQWPYDRHPCGTMYTLKTQTYMPSSKAVDAITGCCDSLTAPVLKAATADGFKCIFCGTPSNTPGL